MEPLFGGVPDGEGFGDGEAAFVDRVAGDSLFLTGLPTAAADLGMGAIVSAVRLKLMASVPAELRLPELLRLGADAEILAPADRAGSGSTRDRARTWARSSSRSATPVAAGCPAGRPR